MKPKQQHAPLNILLTDDDADDRFLFDKALKEIPIVTYLTTVNDGEQLMNYLSENSQHLPDVLFLDINMPRKNGFECLREIKENEKLKDLFVTMFTISYPHSLEFEITIKNMLSNIGAHDYIRKTSDFAQLKQLIHNALIKAGEKRLLK